MGYCSIFLLHVWNELLAFQFFIGVKVHVNAFFLYEIVQPCIFQWLIPMFYKLKNWKTFRGLKYSVYLEINELKSMCRNEPQTLLCWFLYLFSQMFWDHFDTLIEIYDLRWCLFIVCRSLNWQFNNQRVRQRN